MTLEELMLSDERRNTLSLLQENLGYSFKNMPLLNKALTHKSYVNENNASLKNNERFEFLGDSVLDLIVSDYMLDRFSEHSEGVLSKIRAAVVNERSLAQLARKIELGRFLLLGKGEDSSGGRDKNSLLANAFEAIAGAVYRDSDLKTVTRVFMPILEEEIEKYQDSWIFRDYKSDLQEYTQNKLVCIPVYQVIREMGPDHDKQFEVEVMVQDISKGKGIGKSKKEAEQAAAKVALEQFQGNENQDTD